MTSHVRQQLLLLLLRASNCAFCWNAIIFIFNFIYSRSVFGRIIVCVRARARARLVRLSLSPLLLLLSKMFLSVFHNRRDGGDDDDDDDQTHTHNEDGPTVLDTRAS